ncbi:MAG: hypothetical protein ACRC63_00915, partial [Metamycoplasmataceae bacterium]
HQKNKKMINYNHHEILNDMIQISSISSLERTHSFNKIKKILIEDVLQTTKEEFNDKYFQITFNKINNRIEFMEGKLEAFSLLNFIYLKWNEKIITTRAIKDRDKKNLINDLFLLVKNFDINYKLTEEQLDEIDEFKLSIENLDKIILCNKSYYDEDIISRFELARDIKKSNNVLINSLQKYFRSNVEIIPFQVFVRLNEQLKYIDGSNHLNALANTIRSIMEQLIIWLNWSVVKNKFPEDQNSYLDDMCGNKLYSLVKKVKQESNENDIRMWFKHFHNGKRKIDDDLIIFMLDYIKYNPNDSGDNYHSVLNDFIHSAHTIYIKKKYKLYLEMLITVQKNAIKILEFMNLDEFSDLNDKIIARLKY